MAGGVIKRPVQVDFVTGARDAQRTGIITTEGNKERALSGWTWKIWRRMTIKRKFQNAEKKKILFKSHSQCIKVYIYTSAKHFTISHYKILKTLNLL